MSLLSNMRSMEFFDDPLKIYLTAGLVFILIGATCLGFVVWSNTGSRNLVLASSTFVGAFVMLLIQLPLELKEKSNTDFLGVELMIDRDKPEIRQQKYPIGGSAWRIHQEVGASSYLAQNNRSQFDGNREHREQLTRDMALFSLMSFFGAEQYDWRFKTISLHGQTMGAIHAELVSENDECTLIVPQQIQEKLSAAGNIFAKAPILVFGKRLCLPPNSSLTISKNQIEITTPFCSILFTPMPSGSVSYMKPGSGEEAPVLTNGEPRFETRLVTIRTTVTFSRIRAQHPQMKQYEDWSNRIVNGAHSWFENSDHI